MALTVLSLLRCARARIDCGASPAIVPAIRSFSTQASGRTRDLAYYAVLDTVTLNNHAASIAVLTRDDATGAIELLDATIRRMQARLH